MSMINEGYHILAEAQESWWQASETMESDPLLSHQRVIPENLVFQLLRYAY